MDNITVELTHESVSCVKDFCCGNQHLDNFIRNPESLNLDIGKTYIWINQENSLIGYYNISTGHIDQIDEYNERIRVGGSIYINCFAVAEKYHGKYIFPEIRYSDYLLEDCINRIIDIRKSCVGFSFITLNSTEEWRSMYLRNGFDYIDEDLNFSGSKDDKQGYSMYLAFGLE